MSLLKLAFVACIGDTDSPSKSSISFEGISRLLDIGGWLVLSFSALRHFDRQGDHEGIARVPTGSESQHKHSINLHCTKVEWHVS